MSKKDLFKTFNSLRFKLYETELVHYQTLTGFIIVINKKIKT